MVLPFFLPFVAAAYVVEQATSPSRTTSTHKATASADVSKQTSASNPANKQKQFLEQFKAQEKEELKLESKQARNLAKHKKLLKEKKQLKDTMKLIKDKKEPSVESKAEIHKIFQPSVMLFDHPENYEANDDDLKWFEEISSSEFSEEPVSNLIVDDSEPKTND